MKLYIVERWGVNQQGTVGVFSTREIAEEAKERAMIREPDGYHSFEIHELELNVEQPLWGTRVGTAVLEPIKIDPMCCKHPPDGIGCAGTSIKEK